MKRTGNIASWWLTLAVMVIMGWLPIPAGAQQGQNAVYNSSGTCSPNCAVSAAFIDAYAVWKSLGGANFCGVLNTILNPQSGIFPTTGGLIDARGLNSSHVSMKCTASPWAGITSPPPSNILLPAGTIVIPTAWTLPPQTHLIGQGDNPSSGTVIQACTSTTCTNSFSGTAMIQFCSGWDSKAAEVTLVGSSTSIPRSAMSIMSACTRYWGGGCRFQAGPAILDRTRTSPSTLGATLEFQARCA
jgi:hypothetical protein